MVNENYLAIQESETEDSQTENIPAVREADGSDASLMVPVPGQWTADELGEITTFEQAARAAVEKYGAGNVLKSWELGDGYEALKDKNALVGVQFIVLGWRLGYSDFGDDTDPDNRFSVLWCLTDGNKKYRITDGGTGIHGMMVRQFKGDPENFVPLIAMNGLSVGEYKIRNADGTIATQTDRNGKEVPIGMGTTFRFDTAPIDL